MDDSLQLWWEFPYWNCIFFQLIRYIITTKNWIYSAVVISRLPKRCFRFSQKSSKKLRLLRTCPNKGNEQPRGTPFVMICVLWGHQLIPKKRGLLAVSPQRLVHDTNRSRTSSFIYGRLNSSCAYFLLPSLFLLGLELRELHFHVD